MSLHLSVDLPRQWRFEVKVNADEVSMSFAQPGPDAESEQVELEAGSGGDFERADYGFRGARWTPMEDGDPDP